MKSKQVLDVHQMQHLQELGVDTSKANFYWHRTKSFNNYEEWDEWKLHYGVLILARGFRTINCQYVRTFTLQDILDLLPKEIKYKDKRCRLCIELADETIGYYYEYARFEHILVYYEVVMKDENLIDVAYKLLCWAIEQGYVETNKNE